MTRRLSLLALIIFVAATAGGCGYNTLTTKHENVKAKWANVETQLQRRSDLLNNLIETAKLAGVQEQEVFGKIAEARSKLLNASQQAPQGEGGDKTPEQKQAVIDAANSFGGTVGRLLVLQEAYPQLRSNENFLKAQDEVIGTENRIAVARKDYNDGIQDYNTTMKRFPTVISAKLFGFKEEPYFKAEKALVRCQRLIQTVCDKIPRQHRQSNRARLRAHQTKRPPPMAAFFSFSAKFSLRTRGSCTWRSDRMACRQVRCCTSFLSRSSLRAQRLRLPPRQTSPGLDVTSLH